MRDNEHFNQLMQRARTLDTIDLRGSMARAMFWAVACFAIAYFGYAAPRDGNPVWRYVIPVLFGGGGLIVLFAGRTATLRMAPDGLTFQFILGRTFVPWPDIMSFNSSLAGVVRLDYQQPDGMNDPPDPYGPPPMVQKSTLPGDLGIKQRQLITLLETYRDTAVK